MKIEIHISSEITMSTVIECGLLLEKIKKDLTLTNPVYTNTIKHSKWKGTKVPPTLEYWRCSEDNSTLYMPRGYLGELTRHLGEAGVQYSLVNETHTCPDVEINFTGTLKPHQVNAVKDILALDTGVLEAPPAAGKTVTALKVIAERKKPTVIIVHNKEMMYQWKARTLTFTDTKDEEIGLIGDGHHSIGSTITIAIINSLKKCAQEVNEKVGQTIIDEVHRAGSDSYIDTLKAFNTRFMLGLSATPYRNDGLTKLIHLYVGPQVHTITAGQLQDEGQIMRARLVPTFTKFNFEDADKNYPGCIEALVNTKTRNARIVHGVISQAEKPGIVLVVSERTEHCETLQRMLVARGIDAKILTGSTPKKRREQVIQALIRGEGKVLVATSQLIGEGFDLKSLSSIFLTTPIKFDARIIQYVGRVIRTHDGKETPVVFDYVDLPGVLRASFTARLKAYRSMGMSIPERGIAAIMRAR